MRGGGWIVRGGACKTLSHFHKLCSETPCTLRNKDKKVQMLVAGAVPYMCIKGPLASNGKHTRLYPKRTLLCFLGTPGRFDP